MKRITINYEEGMSEYDVLVAVARVVSDGRVSRTAGREHFCAITKFHSGTLVAATMTRAGVDAFHVMKEVKSPKRERDELRDIDK